MRIQLPIEIRVEHGTTSAGWLYTVERAFLAGAASDADPLWVVCRDHGGCVTVIQINGEGMWERRLIKGGVILNDDPSFRTSGEPDELLPDTVVEGTVEGRRTEHRVLLTDCDPVLEQIDATTDD